LTLTRLRPGWDQSHQWVRYGLASKRGIGYPGRAYARRKPCHARLNAWGHGLR